MAHYPEEKINSSFINQIRNYAIFATDPKGKVISWNQGAEKLKGYQSTEIIGQYYAVLFPDEYQQAGLPEQELKLALEQGVFEAEDWRKRKDGSLFWASIMLTPIFDEKGKHLGFTKITGDISKQKALQDKLAERQEDALELKNTELQKINFDLDNFIYSASHDLRSPITNIEALMVLLRADLEEVGCLNNETEEIITRVISSVDRVKQTISDLTDISRVQKNYCDDPGPELLDIKEIYEDIIVNLADPIKQKICSLQTDFQVHQLKFNRKNFRSILYNLISNAVKYQAPDRNCNITISTSLQEPYVLLQIIDNGLGISQHHQQQLYTMFKRFHDHVEGSGIGLYMVKRIIDNAGGKIEVKSAEGEGTTFNVYFKADL
ncbi:PAS domain-containing sensor histidine kinase [Adhaeribacter aquaticus]|uniref:sensor histidine kinase n=1 Tax=Adhaeribacter aquaticus TaxID=299567 RepID=UPI0003F8A913|nr:PAS domain-containing sensor histidine kinase [Adhaeribacter aquaticus]